MELTRVLSGESTGKAIRNISPSMLVKIQISQDAMNIFSFKLLQTTEQME